MIRLQRSQNWDQTLRCPQVFDGKKKDVEAHGETRARKQTETRELRQEPVCLGVLGLIKRALMSGRLYISRRNVSEGLFFIATDEVRSCNTTFVVTGTVFILTGLIERETEK